MFSQNKFLRGLCRCFKFLCQNYMRYENMINFNAELRHVAFCRYVIFCFSFLVDELSPPEVKKRVWVATHSRFSLYLRNENKYIKTDVSASSSNSAEGNGVGMIKNNRVVMGKELVLWEQCQFYILFNNIRSS